VANAQTKDPWSIQTFVGRPDFYLKPFVGNVAPLAPYISGRWQGTAVRPDILVVTSVAAAIVAAASIVDDCIALDSGAATVSPLPSNRGQRPGDFTVDPTFCFLARRRREELLMYCRKR